MHELVLVDDDDGVALLPEAAGLVLGEDGQGEGLLLFMGVECFFLVFLSGDLVFSSSSCLFLSLLCDGVVMVWDWAWCGVCLAGVWGGVGVVVCIPVSRWAWAWSLGRFEICKLSKVNSFQVNFIVTNKNKTLLLAIFFFKSVKILPNFALCEGHAPPKPEKLIFENIGFIIFEYKFT